MKELGDEVEDAVVCRRITELPGQLTGSPQASGPGAKRILWINPRSQLMDTIRRQTETETDEENISEMSRMMYKSLLKQSNSDKGSEGEQLDNEKVRGPHSEPRGASQFLSSNSKRLSSVTPDGGPTWTDGRAAARSGQR